MNYYVERFENKNIKENVVWTYKTKVELFAAVRTFKNCLIWIPIIPKLKVYVKIQKKHNMALK